MKALAIIAVLVLGGFVTLRLLTYSVDKKALTAEIAAAAVLHRDVEPTPRAYADEVARLAAGNGFTVDARDIRVVRKAVRVGVVDIEGLPSAKGRAPEPLHDYLVTVTAARAVFPLWTQRVTLEVTSAAPCRGAHQGDGAAEYPEPGTWPTVR